MVGGHVVAADEKGLAVQDSHAPVECRRHKLLGDDHLRLVQHGLGLGLQFLMGRDFLDPG